MSDLPRPLLLAAMLGEVDVLRVLVQAGTPNAESLIAAAYFAAINGHEDAVLFVMSVLSLRPLRSCKRWLSAGGVTTRALALELHFPECAVATRIQKL